jgi:hypothetical protein
LGEGIPLYSGKNFGRMNEYFLGSEVKVKVKQSRYRPGVDQRVPAS